MHPSPHPPPHTHTLASLGIFPSIVDPELDPEGSETFGRIRSGTEINVSDPDSNPDPKLDPKNLKKAPYFQAGIR